MKLSKEKNTESNGKFGIQLRQKKFKEDSLKLVESETKLKVEMKFPKQKSLDEMKLLLHCLLISCSAKE